MRYFQIFFVLLLLGLALSPSPSYALGGSSCGSLCQGGGGSDYSGSGDGSSSGTIDTSGDTSGLSSSVAGLTGSNGGGAIGDILCTVVSWFTGYVGQGIATLAVIVLGLGALMGKITHGSVLTVIVGIATIFGAPGLVEDLTGQEACYSSSGLSLSGSISIGGLTISGSTGNLLSDMGLTGSSSDWSSYGDSGTDYSDYSGDYSDSSNGCGYDGC